MQNYYAPPTETNGGVEKEEIMKEPIVEIAYRDNELFRILVPKIADRLREINREVNTHSFPQGTPEEEIKKYFNDENLQKSFEGEQLLSDSTCVWQIDRDLRVERMKDGISLDKMANNIMERSLLGRKLYEDNPGEITYKDQIEGLKNILKEIIAENGEPDKLFIVERSICSHQFNFQSVGDVVNKNAYRMYGENGGVWYSNYDDNSNPIAENQAKNREARNSQEFLELKDKSLNDVLNNIGMPKEEYEKFKELEDYNKENDELEKEWAEAVIEKIKNALKEVVDEKKIVVVPSFREIEKGDKNYVILDRHAEPKNEEPRLSNKVVLPLPLASTIYHIMDKKLLKVDFNNMDEAIKEEVDKAFKKEEKK